MCRHILYFKTELSISSKCARMERGAREYIQFVIIYILRLISLSLSELVNHL